jgi:undecaprenyl pyrophosphate phosphatase UppP
MNLMDVSTFYALLSGTCFTLVGLWWNVVNSKKEWHADQGMMELASGVYLSFLIPGLMSLVAQVGIDNSFVWQIAFALAAILGIIYTNRISQRTRKLAPAGNFHKNRWGVNVIYGLILVCAIFPGLGRVFGLGGLQLEAILVAGLLLIGHGLTWELLTYNPTP